MKTWKLSLLLISIIIGILPARAQKKDLAIDDLMSRKLYPQSLVNLQWRNQETFTWQAKNKLIQQVLSVPASDTILSLDQLNNAVQKADAASLKNFPAIKWKDGSGFYFVHDGKLMFYSFGKEATVWNTLNPEAENVDIEPISGKIAYTLGNNLYVSDNKVKKAVTNDAEKNIVNGQAVHRNEFGIDKGTFWSPNGNFLAFYRMDQTMVADYPIVNINTRIASVENIKYPMAGMASHHVTVGVYNPSTGTVVFLKTGEPVEQYLTNISWSPDEKYIFIAVLNRDQDHLCLNQYNATTGEFVKTLFEETDKEYVEPLHGLTFLKSAPSHFIWQSRRDGWNHLYLYDTEGNLISQLTKGNWEVTEFLGLDEKEMNAFFMSTQVSPLERHLCSAGLKNLKTIKLTETKGTHTILMAPGGNSFIDRLTSMETASRYTLVYGKKQEKRLIAEDPDPLKEYNLGETSLITLRAKDGSDLYGRIIKPTGFNPEHKYPVLIYVYGGPHSQLVTDTWLAGAGLFLNYMAEKGYLVFTLDNHGTSNRGADFEQAIHRRLGQLEMQDQMIGVNYLKSLPYVDSARIGLDGWSYGGFMTLNMKLNNPGVFKVATCGGPVVDWKYYEIMYGERYMDTPEQNPEGYKSADMTNYISNLEGRLLVMHGALDNTVVWQNSLQFIQKCIQAGKQVDYFVYPNHEHNVMGKDRLHMFRKLAEYYDQNL